MTTTSDDQRMPDKNRMQCVVTAVTDARGRGDGRNAPTLRAKETLNDYSPLVTGTLSARRLADSERGTDFEVAGGLQPVTFDWQAGAGGNDKSFRGKSRAYIVDQPERARALTANKTLAVAFAQNTRDEVRLVGGDGSVVGALAAEPGMKQTTYVAFHPTQDPISSTDGLMHALGTGSKGGCATGAVCVTGDVTHALTRSQKGATEDGTGRGTPIVPVATMAVRRLTPVECERLQGFPDGWTLIPWKKKSAEECPDGPRYKAMGNSMAVPVMRWIGQRLDAVVRGAK